MDDTKLIDNGRHTEDGLEYIYIGYIEPHSEEIDAIATKAHDLGLLGEFCTMPIIPNQYYVTQETFNLFNKTQKELTPELTSIG